MKKIKQLQTRIEECEQLIEDSETTIKTLKQKQDLIAQLRFRHNEIKYISAEILLAMNIRSNPDLYMNVIGAVEFLEELQQEIIEIKDAVFIDGQLVNSDLAMCFTL